MDKTGHCSCKSADTQEDMSPCSGWPMMVTDTRMWAEEGDGDPDEMLSLHYTRCHHSGVTLVTMQTVSW